MKQTEIEMHKEVSQMIVDDCKKENLISIAHLDYEKYLYLNAEFDELIQSLEDVAFGNTTLPSDEIESYWDETVKVLKAKINKLKSQQLFKEDFKEEHFNLKYANKGHDNCEITYILKDNSKYDSLPSKECDK